MTSQASSLHKPNNAVRYTGAILLSKFFERNLKRCMGLTEKWKNNVANSCYVANFSEIDSDYQQQLR